VNLAALAALFVKLSVGRDRKITPLPSNIPTRCRFILTKRATRTTRERVTLPALAALFVKLSVGRDRCS
jgi:hypothetical protein